jgi:hypothetical protein
MSKKYVFWRTPDGKPYRGSDGKHAPAHVLAQMGKGASINAEGAIQWHDFGLLQQETAVRSSAVVVAPTGEELNEIDAWVIVRGAIASLIKKQGGGTAVSATDVLRVANQKAADHFRKLPRPFVLVSSVSIESFPSKGIRIHESEIRPLNARGRFRLPQGLQRLDRESNFGRHLLTSKCQLVRVSTSGKTMSEAFARGIDALTLLRSLWTLFSTFGAWRYAFGIQSPKPLGAIHPGPLHTLHEPSGTPFEECWFEPDYTKDLKLFKATDGWDQLEKKRRWALGRLRKLRYREDLESLLCRYAIALDQTNFDVAFLQMWGILEKLTDTVGGNYDETIRRSTWMFTNRDLAREMLGTLRLRRNQLVHAAKSADDRDQIVYLVKSFVEPHLLHLLRNDFSVTGIDEYGKHLALPTSLQELGERKKRIGHAIRVIKKWSRPRRK